MTEYKPNLRTQIVVLGSFLALALPAIALSGFGYIWFLEYGLKLDIYADRKSVVDRLLLLAVSIPMFAVMTLAMVASAAAWMFLMARYLAWPDIQYYTNQQGPRFRWLDAIWIRMIQSRKEKSLTKASSEPPEDSL